MKHFLEHFHEILENNVINFPETIALDAYRYARTGLPILLTGETGVGKESMAEFIHEASQRDEGQFKAVNCAALTETLIESELFGVCGNVATGVDGREGLFEMAHGGTLFIDEIGDIPLSIQVKLLRIISSEFFNNPNNVRDLPSKNIKPIKIARVGSTPVCKCNKKKQKVDHTNIPVNVRLIFATNKNLVDLIKEMRFREDFYYRVSILTLRIPSLKERLCGLEDERKSLQLILDKAVKPLFNNNVFSNTSLEMFENLKKSKNLQGLFKLLQKYDWPGNFRQLQQVLINAALIEMENYTSCDPDRFKISKDALEKAYNPATFLNQENSGDENRDLYVPVLKDQDMQMIKAYIHEAPFKWLDDGKNSSVFAFLCLLVLSQRKGEISYLNKKMIKKLAESSKYSIKSSPVLKPDDPRGFFLRFLKNKNVETHLTYEHIGGKKEIVIKLTDQPPVIKGFENILIEVNKCLSF